MLTVFSASPHSFFNDFLNIASKKYKYARYGACEPPNVTNDIGFLIVFNHKSLPNLPQNNEHSTNFKILAAFWRRGGVANLF